jgi:hypothetical protein
MKELKVTNRLFFGKTKIWSANNLEKFLSNLNIIETEFKRNDLNQDTQFYYFLTQNLSKISFKNTNNFV